MIYRNELGYLGKLSHEELADVVEKMLAVLRLRVLSCERYEHGDDMRPWLEVISVDEPYKFEQET